MNARHQGVVLLALLLGSGLASADSANDVAPTVSPRLLLPVRATPTFGTELRSPGTDPADPPPTLLPHCIPDSCNDGLFCNGEEVCVGDICHPGTLPCPAELCDETDDLCLGGIAGRVPDDNAVAGSPLLIDKIPGGILLTWGASCVAEDNNFAIYDGTLGDFASHTWVNCLAGAATSHTLVPDPGNRY